MDLRATMCSTARPGMTPCRARQEAIRISERRQKLSSAIDRIRILKSNLAVEVPDIGPLEEAKTRWEQVHKRLTSLKAAVVKLRALTKEALNLKVESAVAEQALKEAMKGRCPVCGKEVT